METHSYPLHRKWNIWEMWGLSKSDHGKTFSSMQKIGEFDNIHEFWQYWNYIPHSNPSTLFESSENRVKVIIESINSSIEAICIFDSTIDPKPNDSVSKTGSDFFFELDSFDSNGIKTIWDKIVFSLIGETFPSSLDVIGCKVIDKGKSVRFEIWVKFDANQARFSAKNLALREVIKNWFDVGELGVASHLMKVE